MGAVLLSSGTKGKRFALPNSRVMIHQPSGGHKDKQVTLAFQQKKFFGGDKFLIEFLQIIVVNLMKRLKRIQTVIII